MLTDKKVADNPILVKLPNGKIISSTHTGLLNLPHIPLAARRAHIFPQLTGSLLSIGQFCDSGFKATFEASSVIISDMNNTPVLIGYRDNKTKLYMIDLNSVHTAPVNTTSMSEIITDMTVGATNESLYVARNQPKTVQFYHACLGSPSDSTYINAATKGYLDSFPSLTAAMIRKHPPNSIATAKGHLDRVRQGIRSTNESITDWHPVATNTKMARAEVYVKIMPSGELHHDNTGQFPVKSSSGNNYVAVSYCEDANYIHVEPLQTTSAADAIQCHHNIITFYRGCGIEPSFIRLDNQTSSELESYFTTTAKVSFQYVPPNNHRVNKAERAIRTWKNHFISILATADPSFPVNLWDKLLFQSELTLNLLRSSGCTPHISAYHQLHGKYDYSSHPIGPLGCKVLVFEPPSVRLTYGPHGEEGFYIGPAMKHYRCFDVWVTKTKHTRVTDTLSWHLASPLVIPNTTPHDELVEAINNLSQSLQFYVSTSPSLVNQESLPMNQNSFRTAIKALNDIFPSSEPIQRVHNNVEEEKVTAEEVVIASDGTIETSDNIEETSRDSSDNTMYSNRHNSPIINSDNTFDAEKIINHRGNVNSTAKPLRFKVRWLGYSHKSDTWEPIENVQNSKAFIEYVDARPTMWHLYVPNDPKFPKNIKSKSDSISTLTESNTSNIAASMQTLCLNEVNELPKSYDTSSCFGLANAAGSIDSDGNTLKYRKCVQGVDKESWLQAAHEEIVRLVSVRNTMHFIQKSQIPKNRVASYYNPRCNRKWKNGVNIFRVRGTYGGNISDYSGDTAAFTADMATVKILLNKTVSDKAKRWMTADITDMYLHTTNMERPEYMFIDLTYIPQRTFDQFNLAQYLKPGDKSIAVEVTGGMYGLPQAGILAQQQLIAHLETHGYKQCKHTVCLFRHESKDIEFSLIVDDFGISYDSLDNAEHLLNALREKYPITVDYEGKKYAGFNIEFDYTPSSRKVEICMKGYIAAALKRFNITNTHNVYSPEYFQPINYGSKEGQLTNDDISPLLSIEDIKWIQEVVGVMLFYARGVDGTMMTAVNRISSQQAKATENTKAAAIRLLEYAATFPNATLVYYPSDMILYIDGDASYNSESEARSRAGVFFYLGNANDPTFKFINGPIDCISTIIPTVVSSASEAEYATCFIAGKQGLCYRYTLDDINCIQPVTHIITDNKTDMGIATKTCKQKRSKAIDMRYHWIRDRVSLKDFNIVWRAGKDSIADYLTKPHPVPHTLHMRKYFVKHEIPTFSTTKARRLQLRSI